MLDQMFTRTRFIIAVISLGNNIRNSTRHNISHFVRSAFLQLLLRQFRDATRVLAELVDGALVRVEANDEVEAPVSAANRRSGGPSGGVGGGVGGGRCASRLGETVLLNIKLS